MSDTKIRPPAPLLQLKLQQSPDGQVDSTTPIRWCVQPALIQELKDAGFVDPHLLLVVRHTVEEPINHEYTHVSWNDTSRYLVPIGREMQYVSFSRPGINQVAAIIVDSSQRGKGFYQFVFSKDRWGYEEDVLYDDGSATFWSDIVPSLDVSSTIQVEVPKEMFAPEPAAWRKTLVNRYFITKPFDQCHFRRRFIFSLLWTPVFMVLGTIFKLLSLGLALAVGLRNPAIGHLFRPFKGEWAGIWSDSNQTSFWIHQKNNKYQRGYRLLGFPRILMNPYTVFIPPAIVFWIGQFEYHTGTGEFEHKAKLISWGWWKTFAVVVGIELAVVLTIMVVMFITNFITKLRNRNNPEATRRRLERERISNEKKQQRNATRQGQVLRELEAMVCNKSTDEVSIDALRKDKQTIRLRFAHIKSRVCSPFAT